MASTELERVAARTPRPLHLRWRYLGLVVIGGAAGTTVREALALVIPAWGAFALNTFVINVVGAFALGALLETLVRRGQDEGKRRSVRLLLGTGMLGGFTTYSSLATDTALRLAASQPWVALAYSLGTVLVGACATWAGITVAHRFRRRRTPAAPQRVERHP